MAKVLFTSTALRKRDLVTSSGDLNVVEGSLVTVTDLSGNIANIFDPSDESIPFSNPFTSDSTGAFSFYIERGKWKINVKSQNENPPLEGELIIDLSGGGSSSIFDPKDFGATSDTDSNAEIQECIDAAAAVGGEVYLSGTYRSDESLNSKGVTIKGGGVLDFTNATALSLSFSCIYDSGSLVDLGQPVLDIVKGYAQFTLATTLTESLEPGDILFVGSNEQFTNARAAYKKGESVIVANVNGNTITVYGSIFDNYIAGQTTIFKLNPTSPKYRDFTIKAPQIAGCRGIWVKNGFQVDVGCRVLGASTNGVQLQQCVDSKVDKLYTVERDGGTYSGTEYGLVLANCQRVSVVNSTLVGERHGFSTGGFDNDFANDTVAIVCREVAVANNFISQNLLIAETATGASIAGFDLHGNAEYCVVDNNIIHNGVVYAGNNNSFTNNFVYGSNDNGGQLFRMIEVVGCDHHIDGNTFVSEIGRESVSKDVPFFFSLFTHTNTPGVNSNNALMFGGVLKITNNKFYANDPNIVANTKPHEIQWRIDGSFTGGDIEVIFDGNTTQMPKNGTLYSIGLRLLAIASFTTTQQNIKFTESNNRWINCGAVNTLADDETVQFAIDDIRCGNGSEITANNQAQFAYFLRSVKDYAEIKGCTIDGVTQSPIYITNNDFTVKSGATACNQAVVSDNTIKNSVTSGGGSTTRNMGLLIGVKNAVIEDNKHISHSSTNIENLFYIEPWAGVTGECVRKGNIDTGGVTSYQLGSEYFSNVSDTYEKPNVQLDNTTYTSAFVAAVNNPKPYIVDTSGGAFNVQISDNFSTNNMTNNAELEFLDVGGALSTNPINLTMTGFTFMGSATYTLDMDYRYTKLKLRGTDWRELGA